MYIKCKKLLLIMLVLMTGCSSVEEKSGAFDDITNENDIVLDIKGTDNGTLSEMINWNDARIVDIGYYPKFAESTVVQNENFVFYPDEGYKIIRINKKNREKQCIFELSDFKKGTGAQLYLDDDKLFIEYEGDIYSCDVDGKKVKEIVTGSKEKISSVVAGYSIKNDKRIIQGMQLYNEDLYLFLKNFCIVKLDLKNKKFTEVAKNVETGCFFDNELYCTDCFSRYLCKINLKTGKKTIIRGKKGSKTSSESDKIEYYNDVMVVDNQIYYTYCKGQNVPSIYKYNENQEDEKIFTFQGDGSDFSVTNMDQTRVVGEYDYNMIDPFSQMQVFDIRSGESKVINLPGDFETCAFLIDDLVFYSKNTSDDLYLSVFEISE